MNAGQVTPLAKRAKGHAACCSGPRTISAAIASPPVSSDGQCSREESTPIPPCGACESLLLDDIPACPAVRRVPREWTDDIAAGEHLRRSAVGGSAASAADKPDFEAGRRHGPTRLSLAVRPSALDACPSRSSELSDNGRMIMLHRSPTGMFVAATALMVTIGGAQAADEAKYPNWKGQWDTINPRLGGQAVKFDPTKAFGPAQQAPLTPEYQKVHEESMADQAKGGQGNFIDHAKCVPGGMPRMMAARRQEYIVTPETTYIFGRRPTCVAFSPTAAPGRRTSSRPIRAIRSANGSTRTATASTTCSKSRRAARSRGRAPTTRPGCRCTSTISRPSRSGSISTRTIRTFCTTRSPCSTMP